MCVWYILCVTMPKQNWLEYFPYLLIPPMCLLRMSAGLSLLSAIHMKRMTLAVMASLTQWKESATCHLFKDEWGMVALSTTDRLSPNRYVGPLTETPRYLNAARFPTMICSVAVLAETNSEPYVAVSTVLYFLEYQSKGVLLTKCRIPVTDLPVSISWYKFPST